MGYFLCPAQSLSYTPNLQATVHTGIRSKEFQDDGKNSETSQVTVIGNTTITSKLSHSGGFHVKNFVLSRFVTVCYNNLY